MLSVHLAVGVGFYHHFILKLQLEYGLDLVGAIDFAYVQNVTGLSSVSLFENNLCYHICYMYRVFKKDCFVFY